MATYTSSPFTTELQATLFKGSNINYAGCANCLGRGGEGTVVTALYLSNGDGSTRYFGIWDDIAITAETQEVYIRVGAGEDMVVSIDSGLFFENGVTLNASTGLASGDPTDFDASLFAAPSG